MSLLSRLFGGGAKSEPEPETHGGCRIYPAPIKESSGHRVAARIEKDFDGTTKTHQLVRADVVSGLEEAISLSVNKAKQVIDQQGDDIFR